jgi:transmembrane 9 superfamily protein 2/4
MFGFMQTSFFFGYMLVASYAAFIMLGTIGFAFSFIFVRRIYSAVKCD